MPAWLRHCLLGLLFAGMMVLYVLFSFRIIPASVAGWAAALLLGVPLAYALEKSGTWLFERPFLERWSFWPRLAYGVAAMLLMLALAVPLLGFVMRLIEA